MKLSDFDYDLPKDLIAQVPVEPRDASRMMVLHPDALIEHRHFYDLPEYFGPTDVLVFNQSKVIPARILFSGDGVDGKEYEVFFVREVEEMVWEVMVRPGRLFQKGVRVAMNADVVFEVLDVLPASEHGHRIVRVHDAQKRDRFTFLQEFGSIPLPPYIESKEAVSKYQNVYASEPGSVAAPTAGFHFTEELLARLRAKGVQIEFLTLHVGPGTFLPVSVDTVEEHVMHEEFFLLPEDVAARLNEAKRSGKRLISVGTTTTRVLESCMGEDGIIMDQSGSTKIFIYPGYRWKCIDGLITNFHLPKSTLLMLVSSFAGRELVRRAYEEAVREKYRFFSFGDGMLILQS